LGSSDPYPTPLAGWRQVGTNAADLRTVIQMVCFLQDNRFMSATQAEAAGTPADVMAELDYAAQLAA
jgi:hypothetical protein